MKHYFKHNRLGLIQLFGVIAFVLIVYLYVKAAAPA